MASVTAEINNCEDTLDVLALLVSHSVIQVLEGSSQKQADLLAIYRWAAANKAARHSELLEKFWRRQSAHSIEAQETEGSEELNLTLEVVDLLDELNILMLVFEKQDNVVSELLTNLSLIKPKEDGKRGGPEQRIVFEGCSLGDVRLNTSGYSTAEMLFRGSSIGDLETFANVISTSLGGYAGKCLERAARRLRLEKSQIERLHREVAQTHRLLLELLDLEQKAASLGEARITTKQGQAIMLFTIITIIFLPLSFFTSYFGQNVSELTGDPQNPKSGDLWKIAAPISVVVILVALAISFFIVYPWKSGKDFVAGIWTRCVQRLSSGSKGEAEAGTVD
ncbi:hypothetical protein CGCA056_v007388 [Colletotrichum aenigma]|uniref:uncharacterized protein n=1 Tax=Colletotrichum aenigma TaxID=1215731 RepID=UPI001872370A|nr:uncharacterized protein CGCA056_v007388 [Colletotrichum aenigma]KAF5521553.1 hypothetical protein CGCA056_v007388 [Colletotrichum aenigma]